ncbi:hypothetical protein [Corallococcus aberystwythensis]|uniref:Uncharacterized protein n=1 Tax=Corallococcus aberystwythensis TaxID=2316722 RepID=A0A3A8PHE8_9BACT|nr:hypothetical protein [Corallococcus aberystwythensis]RKH55767.1 hypothetical protein D7W81_35550 [Corallococcus aberystwythensis]
MRSRGYLAALALVGIGLVGLYSYLTPSPSMPTPLKVPEVVPEYFAEQTSDCGVDLLNLASSDTGPFKRVLPVGANPPGERLRRNVWEQGRYLVHGRFTGKVHEFRECASFPEFEVLDFKPWGPVQRCASPGALDAVMQTYTGDLPEDRYAPEDFVGGPFPPFFDDESCRPVAACAMDKRRADSRPDPEAVIDGEELPSLDGRFCHPVTCEPGEKRVDACTGVIWCCRLLPPDAPPGP